MNKKYFILLYLLIALSIGVNAQNEKFKALFIYNFTKYIEWPTGSSSGEFVIGVLGNSPIVDELKVVAGKGKVGAMSIVVKQYSSLGEIDKCHMLFVAPNSGADLNQIANMAKTKSILTIASKEGSIAKGSCINFKMVENKQLFEISKKNITDSGLVVNSQLLSLGIQVE